MTTPTRALQAGRDSWAGSGSPPGYALARTPAAIRRPIVVVILAALTVEMAAWPIALSTAGTGDLIRLPLAVTAWLLCAISGFGLLGTLWAAARRGSPFGLPALWAAIALTALALVLGGLSTTAEGGAGYAHPSVPLAVGVGIVTALAVAPRAAAVAASTLTVAYLVGAARTVAIGVGALSAVTTNVASLLVVPILASLLAQPALAAAAETRGLRRQLDAVAAALTAADSRESERARQYRTLHDTVLSTLSALSRGTLDPKEPQVRQRLAADADYLRGLIATSGSAAGMYLAGEIARAAREMAPSGLRVHPHLADIPDTLPDEVVVALSGCIREALNNVVRHSGTDQAWVTVVGDQPGAGHEQGTPPPPGAPATPGAVTVTITDRGTGFDPAAPRRGLGIAGSIESRAAEVGAGAVIDSAPGQGTSVELRWPAR